MPRNPPSPDQLPSASTFIKPLRLLMYVEWILLSMGALVILTVTLLNREFQLPWLELVLLSLLSLMGLYLPLTQPRSKILFTAIELGLFSILIVCCLKNSLMLRLVPIIGMVIMIRSCQIFNTRGRLVVGFLTLSLYLFTSLTLDSFPSIRNLATQLTSVPETWQVRVFQTNGALLFTMVLLFISLLVDALLSVHENQQKLAIAHTQLQKYALRVENEAALQERNRIAREIHDSLGHSLTAQTILLENVMLFWEQDTERAKSYLLQAKESCYQALKDVSRAVAALRNFSQIENPLAAAIPELLNKACQSTPITHDCEINITTPLSDEVSLAAYRIVQEALTNVVKHSQATKLSIQISSRPESLHVQVLDNGKGFDPSKNTTGFGLRGMKERAMALGGTFQFWSVPGLGCHIDVVLPLPKPLEYPAQREKF